MNPLYHLARAIWVVIIAQTMRIGYINRNVLRRQKGGCILAVTHLAHLECVFSGMLTGRDIHWVTRKEFYVPGPASWLLAALNCIRVNRQGIPVSTIRTSIRKSREGHVIGIFPEAGVVRGKDLAIRGGPIKRGACSIAIHSQKPIIPCVILGTDKLYRVEPWLPFLRGRVWVALGEPITPPLTSTRQTRSEMAEQLRAAYRDLYGRLQKEHGIRDSDVP